MDRFWGPYRGDLAPKWARERPRQRSFWGPFRGQIPTVWHDFGSRTKPSLAKAHRGFTKGPSGVYSRPFFSLLKPSSLFWAFFAILAKVVPHLGPRSGDHFVDTPYGNPSLFWAKGARFRPIPGPKPPQNPFQTVGCEAPHRLGGVLGRLWARDPHDSPSTKRLCGQGAGR